MLKLFKYPVSEVSNQKSEHGTEAFKKKSVIYPQNIYLMLSIFCVLYSMLPLLYSNAFAQDSSYNIEKLVGQRAPDFTLKDLEGKPVNLSSFKGKVVLLNFWATWCPPCKAELPSMNKLYQQLKNRGLVIIAVSTDRSVSVIKEFTKNNPLDFIIVIDSDLRVSRSLYKVFMLPTTFIIDKRGIISGRYFGEQDWTDKNFISEIEALL